MRLIGEIFKYDHEKYQDGLLLACGLEQTFELADHSFLMSTSVAVGFENHFLKMASEIVALDRKLVKTKAPRTGLDYVDFPKTAVFIRVNRTWKSPSKKLM